MPELFRDDLGVRRFVALALRLRAEARDRLAGRMDADLARVEHLDAQDVEVLGRAGADDLREARDADAHQLAALALLELLLAQGLVADHVHGLAQGRRVVPAVVLPAEGGLVRKLLGLNEVLHSQLGRIHFELLGEPVGNPFDRVHRLGDAERAAVRDASRRLVRVDAVHLAKGVGHVVRAGADGKEPRRVLRRVRRRVGVAVVGQRLDAQARHRAVLLRRQLDVHVVVAGEGIGLEVLHPVLDPLDRLADDDRGRDRDDVAGIHGHLAPETAAEVRRHDPDLLLGEADVARDEREHRADRVRRLRRHVHRQLAHDPVEVRDAAARLDRGDVDARDVHVLPDDDVGVGGRLFGGLLVPTSQWKM